MGHFSPWYSRAISASVSLAIIAAPAAQGGLRGGRGARPIDARLRRRQLDKRAHDGSAAPHCEQPAASTFDVFGISSRSFPPDSTSGWTEAVAASRACVTVRCVTFGATDLARWR